MGTIYFAWELKKILQIASRLVEDLFACSVFIKHSSTKKPWATKEQLKGANILSGLRFISWGETQLDLWRPEHISGGRVEMAVLGELNQVMKEGCGIVEHGITSSTLEAVLAEVSMNMSPCSLAKASPSSFFTSLLDSRSLKNTNKQADA